MEWKKQGKLNHFLAFLFFATFPLTFELLIDVFSHSDLLEKGKVDVWVFRPSKSG